MAQVDLKLSKLNGSFGRITDITNAGDERIFVVDQSGIIRVLNKDGTINQNLFLNISNKVENNGERGLLGIAFHPNYQSNGYFYVNYIKTGDSTVVSRFEVSSTDSSLADSLSETVLLTFKQPYTNHNGGDLNFGPDGYLYISSGDGGSGGDPQNYAQDSTTLLGKILRIDVDNAYSGLNYAIPTNNPYKNSNSPVMKEIWSLGLRNPWRFSFDRDTGDMWIADVGQGAFEEINMEPYSGFGNVNYGWRCYEGTSTYNTTNCGPAVDYTMPVFEYDHSEGCSVTGGFVYRGAYYPQLEGRYIYADFCSGKIWSLRNQGGNWINELLFQDPNGRYTTFGEDLAGELFLGNTRGELYRICDIDWLSDASNLSISDNQIISGTYQAGQLLEATGGVVANSVYFYAFGAVSLEPGFKVESGAVFMAQTDVCRLGN